MFRFRDVDFVSVMRVSFVRKMGQEQKAIEEERKLTSSLPCPLFLSMSCFLLSRHTKYEIHQGPAVQKKMNANPRLKLTKEFISLLQGVVER